METMKKLLTLLAFFPLFVTAQTCDVDLIGYDPQTHQVSVAIINGENCGCNEYTQQDGNTCGPNSSSTVNNNDEIVHLVFGLHYDSFEYETECQASLDFHPGWTFVSTGNFWPNGGVTGDTLNFTLNPSFGWECMLDTPVEDLCWEFVVWQINLSQTVDPVDFPNDFWTDTCGVCADQTQMYPDIDLSNNSITWCPDELPPSPLYPGCTDEDADNYDPTATFDDESCMYTILGCTSPTACNYDQFATDSDGSCIFCDTPNGEELCNAYHNSDDYWDFYAGLFDCDPQVIDLELDSVYLVAANCNVFNSANACWEGLRFNISFKNKGTVPVDSWNFDVTLNEYEWTSTEYGINFFGGSPYNQPLAPGFNGSDINVASGEFVWEEGDTLFATINALDVIDEDPLNNTGYFILPSYPVCIEGCIDPLAINFNPDATCEEECVYAPPCDTIYVTDTLYITETEFIIDTLYIIEYVTDTVTITETEYLTDTLYITEFVIDTLFIDNYIYLTDTITEYVIQETLIDCETGLPCGEVPPGLDCPDWTTVHIPNTFTPNNDGINDVWTIMYDLNCWEDVEFKIFNRWGSMIYEGYGDFFDSYPYWDGSVNGGNYYVSDGVYVYTVRAKKVGRAEVIEKSGHITVFR